MRRNYSYVFIWHCNFHGINCIDPNPGITQAFIKKFFNDESYLIIRHSLSRGGRSRVSFHSKSEEDTYKDFTWFSNLSDGPRYLIEAIFNLYFLLRFAHKSTVLSIDPLSSAIPVVLKKVDFLNKVFFLTPDFATKRFDNAILNRIYFGIDKFCTLGADINICNSSEVISYKKELYLNSDSDYFHMPNIPPPWIVDKYSDIKKTPNKIVYVGNLGSDINIEGFQNLFSVISSLVTIYPTISLSIIGEGSNRNLLEKMALGKQNILFKGALDHEEVLKEIASSQIGIALYNGDNSYDKFRDSLKVREYQALGTIPLTTSIAKSNTDDISKYESGLLIQEWNAESIFKSIKDLLDIATFTRISFNCFQNFHIYENKYPELEQLIKFDSKNE